MNLNEILLLLDSGVKLEFVVTQQPLCGLKFIGYHVMVKRSNDLTLPFSYISTFRDPKKPRVFRSLSAVNSVIALELKQDFIVKSPD